MNFDKFGVLLPGPPIQSLIVVLNTLSNKVDLQQDKVVVLESSKSREQQIFDTHQVYD
jgi:hypothetical protein